MTRSYADRVVHVGVDYVPTTSVLEDRLMALRHKDIQAIMRERGVSGTSFRDKKVMVVRLADDMRESDEEWMMDEYEREYADGGSH